VETIAIISDIHANHVALETVLSDLDRICPTQVVCLGDVAATGPGPGEVIRKLLSRDWKFVRGNCDDAILRYAAGVTPPPGDEHFEIDQWCSTQLSSRELAFVASFEPVVSFPVDDVSLCCYHGSPKSNLDELLPTLPDDEVDRCLRGHSAMIYAGGHTHVQMVRRFREAYVINPGSVGLPFAFDRDSSEFKPLWAEYALVHIDQKELAVQLRRIPVSAGAIHAAANESKMPHKSWWTSAWR